LWSCPNFSWRNALNKCRIFLDKSYDKHGLVNFFTKNLGVQDASWMDLGDALKQLAAEVSKSQYDLEPKAFTDIRERTHLIYRLLAQEIAGSKDGPSPQLASFLQQEKIWLAKEGGKQSRFMSLSERKVRLAGKAA
jgi:hypothetical protein